jgi:hypothetical protein
MGIVLVTGANNAIRVQAEKKKLNKWKPGKKAVEITRDVSPTWLTDAPVEASIAKADAMREAMYVLEAPNNENHITYIGNIITDPDNAIWPVGDKSCLSSATALLTEMQDVPAITDAYDISLVQGGGSMQVQYIHFMVEMIPVDGIGPAFLVERYSDYGPGVYTIERKYELKNEPIYISLKVKEPWDMIDGWYEELQPEPEYPEICSLMNANVCTHHGIYALVCPCKFHGTEPGQHCTSPQDWLFCPIHMKYH